MHITSFIKVLETPSDLPHVKKYSKCVILPQIIGVQELL